MLHHLALYSALLLGVNAAHAGVVDWQAAQSAGLAKLAPLEAPVPVPDTVIVDAEGAEFRLSDWQGKVLVVNFWATWCAPCREEMPSLDALEAEMGGDDFAVLTIAAGRNPVPAIHKFFEEQQIVNLPVLRDERQVLARGMGVMGLPVTVLVDRDGMEIARVIGELDWASPAVKDVIAQMIAEE